jgi:two-component system C4-dicarboxylate transport sensor histidine kinase DctB
LIQDISEPARLARALREKDLLLLQQSRMAAMGEMVSYITHQWRQPLQIISLLMQNLEMEEQCSQLQSDSLTQTVKQVLDLVDHMSSTMDDFRDFFRTDRAPEPFDLRESIRKIVDFIAAHMVVHNVELTFDAEESLIVLGHANEYSHVLLNILNNAKDALLERGVESPRIHVRLFREGEKKVVTISDNAGGIPEALRDRVFEPYFTTKKNGTGIGLYISKNIIEDRFNGSLTARNVEDGAEFRVEV